MSPTVGWDRVGFSEADNPFFVTGLTHNMLFPELSKDSRSFFGHSFQNGGSHFMNDWMVSTTVLHYICELLMVGFSYWVFTGPAFRHIMENTLIDRRCKDEPTELPSPLNQNFSDSAR